MTFSPKALSIMDLNVTDTKKNDISSMDTDLKCMFPLGKPWVHIIYLPWSHVTNRTDPIYVVPTKYLMSLC
jgi:hypothetical protein